MCQFGDKTKILEELNLSKESALVGYRAWYITNSFNDKVKELKSLNQDYIWPRLPDDNIASGEPELDNSLGIYAYNNYSNCYNYCNYYNCYNYYNYNYSNYYNYNYYYYYYYNNYNIAGKVLLFGKVFRYGEGYRAQFAIPLCLVKVDNPKWLNSTDKKEQRYIEHFHGVIDEVAKIYNITTINWSEFEAGK